MVQRKAMKNVMKEIPVMATAVALLVRMRQFVQL